jgi:PIH1 N-terminal domain
MEKDKNDSNVACFDCCYHPSAMAQIKVKKQFRESLILTAIEGVEEAYKRQSQEVISLDSFDVVFAVWLSAELCQITSCHVRVAHNAVQFLSCCVAWCSVQSYIISCQVTSY